MRDLVYIASSLGISVNALVILMVVMAILVVFDSVMKLIGMWKSARNGHIVWFIFIAIINSVGILPIIYLVWFDSSSSNRQIRKRR